MCNMCCAFVFIVDIEKRWEATANNNKTEEIYISKARFLATETPAIWTTIPSQIEIQELSLPVLFWPSCDVYVKTCVSSATTSSPFIRMRMQCSQL